MHFLLNQCPTRIFTESCSHSSNGCDIKPQDSCLTHTHMFTGCPNCLTFHKDTKGFIYYRDEITVQLKNYEYDDQIRVGASVLKNTKVTVCHISSKPHHSPLEVLRAPHTVHCKTDFVQTSLKQKSGGSHREARMSAQVWPRAVHCCSLQAWGFPPEASTNHVPSQMVPKLVIFFGNHCCLLFSSSFEPIWI